jgi:microcin C transport system substrate-binding protein
MEPVSAASFTKRVDELDYDMMWASHGAGRLRDPEPTWHSKTADELATMNNSGVKNPEIDALIEAQKTEMDLSKRNEILRQIDAKIVAMIPYVLLWQSDRSRLLYWNRFGTPKNVLDKFGREEAALTYWWFDAKKSAALDAAQKADQALPAEPDTVHYKE